MLTLGALVVTLLIYDRSQLREAAMNLRRVVLPVVAVLGTVVTLIAFTGGLGAFVGDVFVEKNDYVRVMNRSLFSGFGSVFDILPGHGTYLAHSGGRGRAMVVDTVTLGTRYFETFRLVPLVCAAVLAWAVWRARGSRDSRIVLCVAFFVAAWASAFPSARSSTSDRGGAAPARGGGNGRRHRAACSEDDTQTGPAVSALVCCHRGVAGVWSRRDHLARG